MSGIARQVYVVSDIHIGGEYPADPATGERGFRIATHIPRFTEFVEALAARESGEAELELVINGDFIDFLAERDGDSPQWVPFTPDPQRAVAKLDDIVTRDRPVFDAMGKLLRQGHRLTILLGNHDIELALPRVRQRFRELLAARDTDKFSFIYDGEAYVIGDALIEHGNRYDKFNVVNHDLLRRVRSLQSRHQDVPDEHAFEPPPGSNIVASIMNPIKTEYPFIDLLKPETEAAIPVLLALEPGARKKIGKIASIAMDANKHRMAAPAMPGFGGDIGSDNAIEDFGGDISSMEDFGSPPAASEADPLRTVLRDYLGDSADEFMDELDQLEPDSGEMVPGEDISSMPSMGAIGESFERGLSLMRLALSRDDGNVERRLPSLLKALRILSKDESFNREVESASEYLEAATELASGGFRCVVFGHTHLPKKVDLGNDACYINTGTWADFMKFPEAIISGTQEQGLALLRDFMADLQQGRLSSWVAFQPTYARLEFDAGDRLLTADLLDFNGETEV